MGQGSIGSIMSSNGGIGPLVVSANKDDELGCATMVWKFNCRHLMSGFCLGGRRFQ